MTTGAWTCQACGDPIHGTFTPHHTTSTTPAATMCIYSQHEPLLTLRADSALFMDGARTPLQHASMVHNVIACGDMLETWQCLL